MLRLLSGLVAAIVLFFIAAGSAGAHEMPRVSTNQSYIESARHASPLDIEDKRAVFQHVLNALPDTVTVYPTENYYYFSFHHAGIRYAGNIRLDIEDRDKGLVHVNYFKDFTPWQRDETSYSALWGAKDGVTV
ncbi:MAG: hypothetical protein OER56_02750, partial [Hyphomicrobiales bacterium]|nr:hypothetical protein [Hyphomicrobiales bacterium]